MRYFYISFYHDNGAGWITLQLDTYPNIHGILNTILEKDQYLINPTVINIIELTKEDYDNFISD